VSSSLSFTLTSRSTADQFKSEDMSRLTRKPHSPPLTTVGSQFKAYSGAKHTSKPFAERYSSASTALTMRSALVYRSLEIYTRLCCHLPRSVENATDAMYTLHIAKRRRIPSARNTHELEERILDELNDTCLRNVVYSVSVTCCLHGYRRHVEIE
jgi:hypothetical protein